MHEQPDRIRDILSSMEQDRMRTTGDIAEHHACGQDLGMHVEKTYQIIEKISNLLRNQSGLQNISEQDKGSCIKAHLLELEAVRSELSSTWSQICSRQIELDEDNEVVDTTRLGGIPFLPKKPARFVSQEAI